MTDRQLAVLNVKVCRLSKRVERLYNRNYARFVRRRVTTDKAIYEAMRRFKELTGNGNKIMRALNSMGRNRVKGRQLLWVTPQQRSKFYAMVKRKQVHHPRIITPEYVLELQKEHGEVKPS